MIETDKEIEAIEVMVEAFEGIEDLEVRKRILWYMTGRFGTSTKASNGNTEKQGYQHG